MLILSCTVLYTMHLQVRFPSKNFLSTDKLKQLSKLLAKPEEEPMNESDYEEVGVLG